MNFKDLAGFLREMADRIDANPEDLPSVLGAFADSLKASSEVLAREAALPIVRKNQSALVDAAQDKGMKLKDLATRLEVSPSYLSQISAELRHRRIMYRWMQLIILPCRSLSLQMILAAKTLSKKEYRW